MTNYFNFNFGLPYGMNNWFMPSFSFQNFFSQFQMPMFNIYDSWFSNFNNTYNFNVPFLNQSYFNYSVFPYNQNTGPQNVDTFNREKQNSNAVSMSSDIDYSKDDLKLDDYNAFKGERLANIALNRSSGWTGYCARYVKNAIQAANLGSYQYGHAYQMTNILKNNKNFKQISTNGVDVSKLPAGCILVYDKNTEGYSKKYGHTEITTGDGRAVSDGITKHLHKKPSAIFIPV